MDNRLKSKMNIDWSDRKMDIILHYLDLVWMGVQITFGLLLCFFVGLGFWFKKVYKGEGK